MKLFLNLITYGLAAIGLFALSGTLLLVVYLIFWSQPVEPQPVNYAVPPPIPTVADQYTAAELWEVVNQWRVESGKQPYIWDEKLCEIGRERVEAIKTDWSHDGFMQHVANGDYLYLKYYGLGENLARDFNDEQKTLDAWLASPSHRENLEAQFTHSCIAVSPDNLYSNFVAHMFAVYY